MVNWQYLQLSLKLFITVVNLDLKLFYTFFSCLEMTKGSAQMIYKRHHYLFSAAPLMGNHSKILCFHLTLSSNSFSLIPLIPHVLLFGPLSWWLQPSHHLTKSITIPPLIVPISLVYISSFLTFSSPSERPHVSSILTMVGKPFSFSIWSLETTGCPPYFFPSCQHL